MEKTSRINSKTAINVRTLHKLNNDLNVKVCDATGFNSITAARLKKNEFVFMNFLLAVFLA